MRIQTKLGAWKGRGIACGRFAPALLAAIFLLFPGPAGAQRNSNAGSVVLNATLNSAITVIATPGLVNFNLVRNGVAGGSVPINITTTWALPLLFGRVTEYAYFTSPASALSDGSGHNIPSASVTGSFNGGAYAAFTGAGPFGAGSSMTLFNQVFFFIFNNPGKRTDTLNLRISTIGLSLPAGTYTGLLNIQAQAL